MWLDRFSSQNNTPSGSPPPPQNRSYSPAPRRSSHLVPELSKRPSLTTRNSSLQLGSRSNASTASLASTRPILNGSALKQQVTPPDDLVEPLQVLADVVGKPLVVLPSENDDGQYGEDIKRPKQLVEEVDFNGLSLQEFVRQDSNKINRVERQYEISEQTVEEYEREKDKFEDLHRSILACDNVLKSVEVSLTSFQKDLGAVSAEIETLQSRSSALNTKLENRKVVEKLLGPAIEEITIAPSVVRLISDGPIDLSWMKALKELEKRSNALYSKAESSEKTAAISDVKPLIDDLTSKAIERIRDFYISQIKGLRSPNINAQIIQQQGFLRYKDLYAFLSRHHSKLAEEIGQAYINTMRWYYLSHFTRYRQALEKVSLYTIDKQDALGADPSGQKIIPGMKPSQISLDALSIGRRMEILHRINHVALTSYLAGEDKQIHHLETPFFHFNLALIDNATFEYSFLTSFFPPSTTLALSRKFSTIFAPTFALGHAFTKFLIENSYDCLGILLCVRINQRFAFELQRRKTPAADPYINGTAMLLWPRFQLGMETHAESVRRATAALPSASSSRALALATSTANSNINNNSSSNQQNRSSAPHMLTQRFGHLLQSILALSADSGDEGTGEPVGRSLDRLRGDLEAFLAKAGKALAAQGRRERFLANNYSLILTIIGETRGKLATEMRTHFEGLREGFTPG